jgi:mono/diheme cytochrome c family protein
MRPNALRSCCALPLAASFVAAALGWQNPQSRPPALPEFLADQAPSWSEADREFFLHGSISSEVLPEAVLAAFVSTYPDLYPGKDLTAFGALSSGDGRLPIGFSRRSVAHLGGLPSLGINCAACHTSQIEFEGAAGAVRVLGPAGTFDVEAYFGAMLAATFRTSDPDNMRRFLAGYFAALEPTADGRLRQKLAEQIESQSAAIRTALGADPLGARDVPPGGLHELKPEDVRLTREEVERGADLAAHVRALARLFHNMRFALHVPDRVPEAAPPRSGPGRNDAFGLLALELFGISCDYAPVKPGIVWNLAGRKWVHWDGNTGLPIVRNLAASLGLGAPLVEGRGILNFADVKRHTDLSEQIRAPRYPLPIDQRLADRGRLHYAEHCASCHDGPLDSERRLYDPAEIGTDPRRARIFDARQAGLYNKLFSEVKIDGYAPAVEPRIRATGKYWAPDLAGVWARAPYLHNGSVRTMAELLTGAAERPKSHQRGARRYDSSTLGFADAGSYVFDTTAPGNSNAGHEYGTRLSDLEKRELLEFLKTR